MIWYKTSEIRPPVNDKKPIVFAIKDGDSYAYRIGGYYSDCGFCSTGDALLTDADTGIVVSGGGRMYGWHAAEYWAYIESPTPYVCA